MYDGPGLGCSKDQYETSSIIRHGLSFEPLNAILVVVPYDPRVLNMVASFSTTVKTLKQKDLSMVIPLVTKFNTF